MIPLFKPYISDGAIDLIKETISSGYIGEGGKVKQFELELGRLLGKRVVTTNSCTAALSLAYHMIGVNGCEVISTPMTCLATNIPLLHAGAKIVWADVDQETGNMSPDSLSKLINPKTKAVVVVHYGGNLVDSRIYDICREHNVPLVEDCAHLFHTGYGDYQCYSFQAIKFLTTGDGGALVTGDTDIYKRTKLLRWYGIDRESGADMRCLEEIIEPGYKCHMNDINASIGLANLKDISGLQKATVANANVYNKIFSQLKHIKTIPVKHRNDYWLYVMLVDDQKLFMEHMRNSQIHVSMVHARNDTQSIFKDSICSLPGLDKFWKRQICIPVGWWVENGDGAFISDRERIIDKVCEYDEICTG